MSSNVNPHRVLRQVSCVFCEWMFSSNDFLLIDAHDLISKQDRNVCRLFGFASEQSVEEIENSDFSVVFRCSVRVCVCVSECVCVFFRSSLAALGCLVRVFVPWTRGLQAGAIVYQAGCTVMVGVFLHETAEILRRHLWQIGSQRQGFVAFVLWDQTRDQLHPVRSS